MEPNKGDVEIKAIQSNRYVITIKRNKVIWKMFQIAFGVDGTLYIHFPYHSDSNGIASVVTLDPNIIYPAKNISLTKQGKVTSHKIKFSHHPSGQVHFSQTGKIFTHIKKTGVPIGDIDGHIFTVMLQDLSWFKKVTKEKDKHHHSPDRAVIEFNMTGMPDLGFKFVGLWKPFESFVDSINIGPNKKSVGPHIVRRFGKLPCAGFLLNPLPKNPMHSHVLVLSIESIDRIDKERGSSIIFIGGFDSIDVVNNKKEPTSFLSLLYPSANPEQLKKAIGSIDLDSPGDAFSADGN